MRQLKNIDEERLARQKLGVQKWNDTGRSGCINYFTGVGKTLTALLAVDQCLTEGISNVTIVVPNAFLITQWYTALDSVFYKYEYENKVSVVSADYILANDFVIHTGLLIIDEFHVFYSKERRKIPERRLVIYQHVMALTATYEDTKGIYKEMTKIIPIIDHVGEKEALAKGWISPSIEFNLGLEFTEEEQRLHDKHTEIIKETLSKFGKGGLDLAQKCLGGGYSKNGTKYTNRQYCDQWARYNGWHHSLKPNDPNDDFINKIWHPNLVFGYAVNLMKAIKGRKELIYTASAKVDAAVRLLDIFQNTKGIVFSQSTVFADTLYTIMQSLNPDNAVIYHSKVKTQILPSEKTGKPIKFGKTRLKNRAIKRLKTNLSNHLITSSVLDKGLDVPELRLGITTSGTQNPNQHKQRKNRSTRVDQRDDDKVALIVNLYIKNSKETAWLRRRQEGTKNRIYWITEPEQVSYTPNANINDINVNDI